MIALSLFDLPNRGNKSNMSNSIIPFVLSVKVFKTNTSLSASIGAPYELFILFI